MKKSTMKSLVAYLNDVIAMNGGEKDTDEVLVSARDEMEAELNKGEAKAQANRDLYAQAKELILGVLSETPATIQEIYDEIASELPNGFTKSKVQYAITRMWADEVVKTEGKINTYSRK